LDLARASRTENAAAGPAMVLAIEYCEGGIALEALLTQTHTNRGREGERETEYCKGGIALEALHIHTHTNTERARERERERERETEYCEGGIALEALHIPRFTV
jgi:hypothetical protein